MFRTVAVGSLLALALIPAGEKTAFAQAAAPAAAPAPAQNAPAPVAATPENAAAFIGDWTLTATFLAAATVLVGSIVVGLVLDRRLDGTSPRLPSAAERRELATTAAPFATFSMLGIAYTRIDTVIVAGLVSGPALAVAGAYFAASRLIVAFEDLPEAGARATFPELSRRVVAEPEAAAPLLRQATLTLLAIGAALVPVLVTAGSWLMATLFTELDPASGWILAGLALALPWRFVGYLLGTALTSADAMGRRVAAAGIALAVVVVVNVIGLPIVGIAAAVGAALVASLVLVVLYGRSARERFGPLGLRSAGAGAIVVDALVATAVGLALRTVVAEPVAAGLAGLVYLGCVAVLPGWPTVLGRARRGAGTVAA